MSITILPMAEDFGWDMRTVGIIQSSFFWGYLLTQIAGGVWSDRFGGKRVLGFGVACVLPASHSRSSEMSSAASFFAAASARRSS